MWDQPKFLVIRFSLGGGWHFMWWNTAQLLKLSLCYFPSMLVATWVHLDISYSVKSHKHWQIFILLLNIANFPSLLTSFAASTLAFAVIIYHLNCCCNIQLVFLLPCYFLSKYAQHNIKKIMWKCNMAIIAPQLNTLLVIEKVLQWFSSKVATCSYSSPP